MSFRKPRGWDKKRAYVLARDGYVCHICEQGSPPADAVDHVIPRADGGTHALANLRAAHTRCNASKGARSMVALMPIARIDRRWG